MKISRSLFAVAASAALIASACGSDDSSADTSVAPSAVETVDEAGGADTVAEPADTAIDCPPTDGSGTRLQTFDETPPMCLDPDASYQALVVTNKGEFTIELDQEKAPATTNSFVFLARNQYFDDTICHRIIPDFVVQCGDPTGTGTGGPGYTIVDELPDAGDYKIGSIAMANTGTPDSGGSQFFIITGEQGAALPPQYTLFGEVVEGFDETVVPMEAVGTGTGEPSEQIEIYSITIIES